MTQPLPRVVLDTVVYVQALISGRGPSAKCIEALKAGKFLVLLSRDTLEEMREVPLRAELTTRYKQLSRLRVEAFVEDIKSLALFVSDPPEVFSLPRDPDDEGLVNLAVAGQASYLVTWNHRHLTYLMRQDTPEGKDFCARFPGLQIVSPAVFIATIISAT